MTIQRMLMPLFALVLMLATPQQLLADQTPPIEPLKGAWTAVSFNGEPPEGGMKMTMTFLTDKVVGIEVKVEDKQERVEVEYTATADGKITFYYDKEKDPEGTKAAWKILDDKSLQITNDGGDVIIFKPKPKEKG